MARLIDAELLKQNCKITGGFSDNFVMVELKTLGEIIDQQPTVDAAEVVHGEWLDVPTPDGVRLFFPYKCSKCQYKESIKSRYCPNCGAKLDGGDK